VLIACWSVKGGVGTTVVASALAVAAARSQPEGALLVDLDGDAGLVCGVNGGAGLASRAGVLDWLSSGSEVPDDALARLEVEAGSGLALLPRGTASGVAPPADRAEALARELSGSPRTCVVDCGLATDAWSAASVLAGAATRSLLIVRNCYLTVRRALEVPLRPSGVVVVEEPGRSLGPGDIGAALQLPVVARIPFDPAVGRAADAGIVRSRLPRPFERAVQRLL
jgi:MinD-like ATPase involved in chromosome partitioning or flagellar assembly